VERIGILGGTFDPPHIGHLILAEYALDALRLNRVLFVPAADPPHKQDEEKIPIAHRLAMLKLAIEGQERFEISRVDIDRPGPHYSLDMVQIIQRQHPDAELYFIMGGDSLHTLPKWHRPAEFIQQAKLAVMRRPGDPVSADMHEGVLPGLAERVVFIDAPLIGISSTEIVERLAQGKTVRYLVPDAVLEYIVSRQLYGVRET
jgi:nicotinate-nucleotide adenylyltransferase